MFMKKAAITALVVSLLFTGPSSAKAPGTDGEKGGSFAVSGEDLVASVVRIEVTDQQADYVSPWKAGRLGSGVGSGFVIDNPVRSGPGALAGGKKILTNAHVVSNARFITLTREGVSHPYTAHVEFIGHDCDLALVTPDDPGFFTGTRSLQLGALPKIESAVSVYGYPLGGERMSVTRGVVSRIDFDTYSHSAVDSHLVVQIDAAINPGNSGGPVLQDGKIVGVAFQGYSGDVAQNVGFMIPTPVIGRFLMDLSKGSYTGYADLSMDYRPLGNPTARRALGIQSENIGVLVTDVHEPGSSAGHLRKDDVLLAIDGHPIRSDGRVELDGDSVEMSEIVERKFSGDTVSFDLLRSGSPMQAVFPLRGTWPFRMQSKAYEEKPRYLLHGGLLFQPLDRNFMESFGDSDPRIRRTFDDFVQRHLYLDRPEVVVLSRVLPDPVNKETDGLRPGIVDTINGRKIRSLNDIRDAVASPARFDVINLLGNGVPIVLKRDDVLKAESGILERYGIPSSMNL